MKIVEKAAVFCGINEKLITERLSFFDGVC